MASTLKVNNLDTASGSTITLPTGKQIVGTDAASIYAPGMVVQFVESSTTSNRAEISSNSYVATNCFIDITPKFANSKIQVRLASTINTDTNSTNTAVYTYYRRIGGGSFSNIRNTTNHYGIGQAYSAQSRTHTPLIAEIVDAPNTTSIVRYQLYLRTNQSIKVELPCTTEEHLVMTAMEIKQ